MSPPGRPKGDYRKAQPEGSTVSDDNQILIPPSFIALYIAPGRTRPSAARREIAERYELCEDMASLLMDTARNRLWELSVDEAAVLQRILRGLRLPASGFSAAQARWIVYRLVELLGWPPASLDEVFASDGAEG